MEKQTKIKIIIISIGVLLILCVILLFSSGNNDNSVNAIDSYNSSGKSEEEVQKDADYWLNYDEKTAGSNTGTLVTHGAQEPNFEANTMNDENLSLSDVTDDEDLLLLQTQQKLKNNNLKDNTSNNNNSYSTYTPAAPPKTPAAPPAAPAAPAAPATQPTTQLANVETTTEANEPKNNQFFTGRRRTQKGNTISAVVQGEQVVTQGSTIKIRLLEDMKTETGINIPKGTSIWGIATITNERIIVNISSVLLGKDLININKTVYDIDGQKGLNLPANVKAEIAKRAEAQSIQNAPTDNVTNKGGIIEKGAGAVVNTAKSLLSKKADEIKVTVKSNYQIVLK